MKIDDTALLRRREIPELIRGSRRLRPRKDLRNGIGP